MNGKVSRELIAKLKLGETQQYAVALKAGIHPTTLSRLIHGAEPLRPNDGRVLAVGKVLGLNPEDCFEK
jgi:hypothetical protein